MSGQFHDEFSYGQVSPNGELSDMIRYWTTSRSNHLEYFTSEGKPFASAAIQKSATAAP